LTKFLASEGDVSVMKEDAMVKSSHLRRLRFIEAVISNIPFALVLFLFFVMPVYMGLPTRVTASLILVLFLCDIKSGKRLKKFLYVSLLPFMKPLWDYEQQRLTSYKSRRNDSIFKVFIVIVIIGFIFVMIYPPPMPKQINWESLRYSLSGSLIGLNIGMVLKTLTEKFD
jgi:hypothetical protein